MRTKKSCRSTKVAGVGGKRLKAWEEGRKVERPAEEKEEKEDVAEARSVEEEEEEEEKENRK